MGTVIQASFGTSGQGRPRTLKDFDDKSRALGGEAYELMNKYARGERKLGLADRVTIARRLHDVLQDLYAVRPELRKGTLAKKADLGSDSKRIHELTLPPGELPSPEGSRRLAARIFPYAKLINAIHKELKNDIHFFTYELLAGTALMRDGVSRTDINLIEKIGLTVNQIAGEVGAVSGLLESFQKTATLKSQAIAAGGHEVWPFHDGIAEELDTKISLSDEMEAGHIKYRNQLSLPQNSFWQPDYAEMYGEDGGVLYPDTWITDSALSNLPHVHLGMWWDEAEVPDAIAWWKRENIYLGRECQITGKSRLDAEPRFVDVGEKGDVPRYCVPPHPAPLDFWLVLLPDRNFTRVIPVLWQAGGDYDWGNVRIEPLTTVRSIERLQHIERLHSKGGNLLDALKDLLLEKNEESGLTKLQFEWQRTASLLNHNPFLKVARDDAALDLHLNNLLLGK